MTKRFKILVSVFGLAVFLYLILDFGISNIILNVEKTGWWFIPVIAIWAVMYLLNASAWYVILGNSAKQVKFRTVYALTVTGFSLNYVTPLINLGGEPYRMMALRDHVGMHRSVASVILYNMVRMLSHFFFWLGSIVLVFLFFDVSDGYKIFLCGVSVMLIGITMFFFSRHKKGIFESLIRLFSRARFMKSLASRLEKREATLLGIDEEIKHLYNNDKRSFYLSLTMEFVARVIGSLEFYFIFLAVGINLSFLHAIYINAGSSFILNLFFFMPFELGTREGGLYLVMDTLRYPPGLGIYMALVNRLREFFWILVGLLLIQSGGGKVATAAKVDLSKATIHESTVV